jgi:hypothetical protein
MSKKALEPKTQNFSSNSNFIESASKFLSELVEGTKLSSNMTSPSYSKPLSELWQLKDRSVSMKKSIESFLSILEEPILYSELDRESLFVIFKKSLSILTNNMNDFCLVWSKMVRKDKSILPQTYHKYGNRSNWLGLWAFRSYLQESKLYSPQNLEEELRNLWVIEKESYERQEREFARLLKKERGQDYVPTPFLANFVREDFLRPHLNFAYSLESLIDQMSEF